MEISEYSNSLNAISKTIIVIISVVSTTLGVAIISMYFNFTQYFGYIVFGSIISSTVAIILEGNTYANYEPDSWEYVSGLISSFLLPTGASALWFIFYWIIIGAVNVYLILTRFLGMDVTMIPTLFAYNLTRYPAIFLFYGIAALNCTNLLHQLFPDDLDAKSAFSNIAESENKFIDIIARRLLPLSIIIILFILYNSISLEFIPSIIKLLINIHTITFFSLGVQVILSSDYYDLEPILYQEQSSYNVINSLSIIFQSIGCGVEILPTIPTSDYVNFFKDIDLRVETDRYIYLMSIRTPDTEFLLYKQEKVSDDVPFYLIYASWAYRQEYSKGLDLKIVRPALVFVGMRPSSMIRAFSLKEKVDIIEIPEAYIIDEILSTDDSEYKNDLISQYFGIFLNNPPISENISDNRRGEKK